MRSLISMVLAVPLYSAIGFSVETIPYLICIALLQVLPVSTSKLKSYREALK
jgi:hypothetical protein